MKTNSLSVPENELETEAEMHAAETRYAVEHAPRANRPSEDKNSRQTTPTASRNRGKRK